ncbi:hypothetical protein ARMGADRAFT_1088742 [Armillaria gallica]|uniref:Uncharacterized protein n=1 Tax=Armillaria gallica TaxID=47427 RepID=A0A2H3CLV0_ARMGA|nr:hypothetical protein ARMGADRAFT_1088742 [Armillaria gallica]
MNIRRLWVTKGRTHADIKPKQESSRYIDDDEKERLHTDLQGWTGETDSEAEDDDDQDDDLEPEHIQQNTDSGDGDQA